MNNQRSKPAWERVCVVGAGGSARETMCCIGDVLEGSGRKLADVACFMERDEAISVREIHGVRVIGQSEFDADIWAVVVAVGPPLLRRQIVDALPPATRFATVIHPTAVLSPWVSVGEGSVITAGGVLTCDVSLGKHAQLNVHTTVGHDCVAGDYFTTAPGVNIAGNCSFGDCVYLGTNASVREGLRVVDGVLIGMGAVVVKSIDEPGTYVGNPARRVGAS